MRPPKKISPEVKALVAFVEDCAPALPTLQRALVYRGLAELLTPEPVSANVVASFIDCAQILEDAEARCAELMQWASQRNRKL